MSEHPQQEPQNSNLSGTTLRWLFAGSAALLMILGLALTWLIQRPAPPAVLYAGPQGSAGQAALIRLEFSEAMNRKSITGRLVIAPAIDGAFEWWNDSTLIYRPAETLTVGVHYTVTLAAGASSQRGTQFVEPLSFDFTVRGPRLAYAAPASTRPENLWWVDPANPDDAAPITFSTRGIYDFAVSPDGGRIAYAERSADSGGIEIMLLTLDTGAIEQITDCRAGECTSPVWHPDGSKFAFDHRDNTPDSPPTVWLADLRAAPPDIHPLFNETDVRAYAPSWSPDGTLLSLYNETSVGLSLLDMQSGEETMFIPTQHAGPAYFSPDGRRIAFADIVLSPTSARTHFNIFDLATQDITALNTADAPLDDEHALWTADSDLLLVSRQYLNDRYTPGKQLYRVAPETGDAKPLLVDEKYYHGYFELDPSGGILAVQRIPESGGLITSSELRPEIWTFDLADGSLMRLATDAFLPHWAP